MDKVKELKIDSTLWDAPSKLVNLLLTLNQTN